MGKPLALSYVITLLGLLLGAPYLMFAFARRIRGSAVPIVHGASLGIAAEVLATAAMTLAVNAIGVAALQPALAVGLTLGATGLGTEVVRAFCLGRISTGVRTTRAAAHFGFGWGCGVAACRGVLLLLVLWALLYGDFEQMLASFPAPEREKLAAMLGEYRRVLFEISPLRPPLEHVIRYGLDALFHLVFTLVVIRAWTRGETGAWLRAGALHALLSGVTAALLATRPGWGGLLSVLLLQGSLAIPASRWAARQIVGSSEPPPSQGG